VNDSPARPARAKPPALADFHHLYSDTVRHGDTDAVGHVNNAVYATYFETGRVQFTDALLADAGAVELDTVLARIEIDFISELHPPATVQIGVRVGAIGRTSITFEQAVFCGERCAAAGRAVVVLVDKVSRRPSPLPAPMRARLEGGR